jgi:hypothetical protein
MGGSGMIRKEGDKYVLRTKDGRRVLGRHRTKKEAEAQERAIQANKLYARARERK